jgi:Zn-finger protein
VRPKIHFSKGGFDFHTDRAPKAISKKAGVIYLLTDCTITHLTSKPETKEVKEYLADVIILQTANTEKIITKLKPKLAILMHAEVDKARDLHKKTGVQVIAAQDGQTVDLCAYSALPAQKHLSKFIKEK